MSEEGVMTEPVGSLRLLRTTGHICAGSKNTDFEPRLTSGLLFIFDSFQKRNSTS